MVCMTSMVMLLPESAAQVQKTHLTYKEIDAKFAQVWNTSEAVRETYSWFARTEVIRDDETVNLLVEKYTFVFFRATIGQPDVKGILQVSGSDIITKGDQLAWWIDTNTYSITKATISASFEDTGVEFTAFYDFLPTGLNYMNRAEIRVPEKSLVVKLYFYDFTQTN